MQQEIGKQKDPDNNKLQYINYEGLKRVFKPKNEREQYFSELEN